MIFCRTIIDSLKQKMLPPETDLLLKSFIPVTLEEMDNRKLMNRMDFKYVFPQTLLPTLLVSLTSGYRILMMDNNRAFRYNTQYLDTSDDLFYMQHVTGKLSRYKIRFRKYESSGTSFLEIKKKTNRNRTVKWRIQENFNDGILDESAVSFIQMHTPSDPSGLQPKLGNSFVRITLPGISLKERITIDTCMSYVSADGVTAELPYLAIAELKSDGYPAASPFIKIMRQMGIRSTGFSKYCIGNALLRDVPKKNSLKQKLILLNKIENEYSKFYVS